jgi:tetratricopeptide (TPR) repeat protein
MKHSINFSKVYTYALITIIITSNGVGAKEINHANRYQDCMKVAKSDPQKAFDAALNWRGLGGGDAATHCVAVALFGLGQYRESAKRLEKLALNIIQKNNIKAGILAHAAQGWILAGNMVRAEAVLTAAIKLMPDNAALMVDRAQARAGQRNFTDAIRDLNHAIKLDGHLTDAFVFRASAYRHLEKLEKALSDVEKALRLQPEHPEGLLERGNLKRLLKDNNGARKDWLALIKSSPKSPSAEDARKNLEVMNLKKTQ